MKGNADDVVSHSSKSHAFDADSETVNNDKQSTMKRLDNPIEHKS